MLHSIDPQTIALLIPLVLIQIGLFLYALYDLFQEDRRVRGGSKIIWALIVVFVNIVGPLIYFFVGRDESHGAEADFGIRRTTSTDSIDRILTSWPKRGGQAEAGATGTASLTGTAGPTPRAETGVRTLGRIGVPEAAAFDGLAISTTGLTKRYGARVTALDHLDLSVPSGSIFGFLGPNGAGKTTTLRLLTGLARASEGTGAVAGIEIGATDGRLARNIGYLDQDPRFYGWMRGRELLAMVGQLHGLSGYELRQRVGEVLEIVGLSDAADRRIGGYSGGMRQRLGIGQAIINQPRVLFLDEPVSSLDPEGRRDVLEIVARLRGVATVFMSTHILNDVERVCDRVAILNFGHLVVEGPIDELLDRYAQPVYEIEPEPQQDGALEQLAGVIRGQPWVREVQISSDTVRVFVNDPKVAGPAILPLVAATGVTLARFERARPSLEDVFLRLVAERPEIAVVPKVEIPVTGLDARGFDWRSRK